MQNVGGYNVRNYGNTSPNFGSSRGQINDLQLPQQYLNLEDEFGDLPERLQRRFPPSNYTHHEEGNQSLCLLTIEQQIDNNKHFRYKHKKIHIHRSSSS